MNYTFPLAALLAGLLAVGAAQGQNGPPSPNAGAPQALTAAEQAKVVLAPYKPASLSADDAKALKRALREAGLRRSRELDAALRAAGFSPEKLDVLDPPPLRPVADGPAGPAPSQAAPKAAGPTKPAR
jgi:hypothetical protein